MQSMQNFYQPRTQPFLNGLSCNYITGHNSAVSQPFEVNFFMTFYMNKIYFFLNLIFLRPMGKMKSIFELASNLTLVLTKLDTELGLAQPQLVLL